MRLLHQQQGVALVTALLVVSIAVILAAGMLDQLHYDTRRTENMIHNEQAYLYTLTAEHFAIRMLRDDLKSGSTFDSLGEDWAFDQLPPFPLEGGSIAMRLYDLQGRFNLNNLSRELNNNTDNFNRAREQFRRLLQTLAIDPGLTDGVIDWLDQDITTTPTAYGAEDDYYMILSKPYRAGNGLMSSASELRLVKGFNELNTNNYNIFKLLAEHVTALPVVTEININTAKAIVLESISDDINETRAKAIADRRGHDYESADTAQPFETVGELPRFMLDEFQITNFPTAGLTVASDYFLLVSHAEIGRGRVTLYSIIHRSSSGINVIQRSQGAW